jgi:hypothetical protein
MAVITRADITRQLRPGLAGLLGNEYKRYANQYLDIYTVKNSDKAQEEMPMVFGFGLAPIKGEGGAIFLDDSGESWMARADHITTAIGFAITEEAIEDNLYEAQAVNRTESLMRALGQAKEVRGAAVLNQGFAGGPVYGDGVVLFSASHPLVTGGTFSNVAAVDLSEAGLKNAEVAIQGLVDDRGILVNATGAKLIFHPADQFTAFEIMRSDLSTTTVTNSTTGVTNVNNTNSLRSGGYFSQGMARNNYLTDNDAWFIKTDVPNGMIHWNRRAPKLAMKFNDPHTGNIICSASERYSFMVGDPRGMYGSQGAG